jgi:hypothetical protein
MVSSKMGHSVLAVPPDQYTAINFTAPPGGTSGLYYSLCFQLVKWEYKVQKSDEWLEVSPEHAQYYQITHKQKEDLEARIKAGLGSVSQAVADLELLKHDQRKYRDFLDYFGYDYKDRNFKKVPEKRDEHSLKAVFIDQVDVHTGDGIAMRSIVSRWPTLIMDFMKLNDEDVDIDKVKKKMDVSKAEAVVLVTKNKLYQVWKKMFEPEVKSRYLRIMELVRSREESVNQYREWLKPVIARHKLIDEGLSSSGFRKGYLTSFYSPTGQATSVNRIVLWAWRELTSPEIYKVGTEILAKKPVDPYDDWTKRNLIFHKRKGLVVKYPWVTDEWVLKKKDEMIKKGWIDMNKLYYSFFIISLDRSNMRGPTGSETEDGVFKVGSNFFSLNILFVKLLEMKAKQEEFERYIDGLLGVERAATELTEVKEKKDYLEPFTKFFDYFSIAFGFLKRGPYEKTGKDRISKLYLVPQGGERLAPIVNFIKQKSGFGMK